MGADGSRRPGSAAESTYRAGNGVRLHTLVAGEPDDPLVVLLHGFPEFCYQWHEYVDPLVAAGYRVLVPDQRGYNLSEKPDDVRAYRVAQLTRDVVELIRGEGHESAHVVGHDWGAMVGWELALRYPAVVDRLCLSNVPHPAVFAHHVRRNPTQLKNSWYALFFQLPRVPEWLCRRRNFEPLVRALREQAAPGTFSEADLDRYRSAWRRPRALPSMIDWYRARARHYKPAPRSIVTAPTLIVWGEQDFALEPEMAPESLEYCQNGRLERFPEASHWLPHERPGVVLELLVEHLEAD